MLWAGVLLLALASQDSAGAAADAAHAAAVAQPTMMIVEFPRGARFVGLPRRCPGSTDDNPEDEICIAELYQGPAFIVRHLSGPRVGRGEPLRLTAHARRWPPGTRMLVLTLPFEDQGTTGNFAHWWHLPEDDEWASPEEDDDYCLSTDILARWGDNPVTRQFVQGTPRRFRASGYLEKADFRCIRG